MQEHGYARFTPDVAIIVPNVAAAHAVLSLNGFRENPGSTMSLTDRVSKVEVDLLPGGGSVGPGPLPLPMPQKPARSTPIVDLPTLLEVKLSSYLGSSWSRLRDLADVIELIKANRLARVFDLDPAVQDTYRTAWDGLSAESEC